MKKIKEKTMKTRLLGVLGLVICLAACNSGKQKETESSEEGDKIVLQQDTSENYTFDTSVSNENGSMSYEIFVRSFYDTNGDGIGDLKGVEEKIPYLADLGIKTIWLMPICPSPSYHGYDISDYYNVNREYGTLDDFDDLVATAKTYHIDIMIDMVLNHSSTYCQWFIDSYNDAINGNTGEDSKADWYCWSETSSGGYHKYRDLWVESNFSNTMPEFNYESEGFKKELDNVFKFWIEEHGVKGFRLDAVLYFYYLNHIKNVEVLTMLEDIAHKYDPDFYMVGECWQSSNIVLRYYDSKCDSFFAFNGSVGTAGETETSMITMAKGSLKADTFLRNTQSYEKKVHQKNENGYSSYFLANHDTDRASYYLTDVNAKVAASILTLMPGTPFMYYGEEIELKGVRQDGDNSDARRRLPMIWSKENKTGECSFPERNRQDLKNNDQVELGVNDQLATNFSLVNHYKKLINVRNKYPVFKHGIFTSLYDELELTDDGILAYKITEGNESITIITNVNNYNVELNVGAELTLADTINTSHQIPELNDGVLKLGSKSTVILK